VEKTHAFISVAFLALVSAVLVPRDPAGAQGEAPSSAPRETHVQKDSAPAPETPDDPFDALGVLGESFGVDLSPAGLRRTADRELRTAGNDKAEASRRGEAKSFLKEFEGLAIERLDLVRHVSADCMATMAKLRSAADTAELAEPTSLLTDAEREAVGNLVDCYFHQDPLDTGTLRFAVLRQAAKRQGIDVNFLIALLPDPIDSFTGWQFDPMLDAISQAISASDYVFERYQFPDTDSDHNGSATGRTHEDQSSVVLYHRRIGPSPFNDAESASARVAAWPRESLMLLIVHENPSAGVHSRALINAIRLVTGWYGKHPSGRNATIRILGPTFSGSADSIARELSQANRRRLLDDYTVRFVSGSATDEMNKTVLEKALPKVGAIEEATKVALGAGTQGRQKRVSFRATVQPDSVLVPKLIDQIENAGWSRPMAVLFEGNTQYGRGLLELLRENDLKLAPAAPHPKENAASLLSRSRLVLLPFPMNVSRVRNRADDEKRGLTGALGMPSKFRRLEMEAVGKPADQIPQMSPSTTGTYIELALSGMLRTMRTERVRTIALMATDPRDKLFLARQISRDSPNVSILTAESDSLYIHPDYSSYLQGALVASTYPLYSGNQRWSYGFEGGTERREFANGSAIGIYNATLALLNYDEQGRPGPDFAAHHKNPPHLIEYGTPGEGCAAGCVPPIWISVVGRNGAWPVRAYPVPPSDYVFAVHMEGSEAVMGLATFPSPTFIAVFVLLVVGVLVCWTATRPKAIGVPGARDRFAALVHGKGCSRGRAYMLVGVLSLFTIEMFLLAVSIGRVRLDPLDSHWGQFWTWTAVVMSIAALAALGDVARRLIGEMATHDRLDLRKRFDPGGLAFLTRAAAILFCVWAAISLQWYVWRQVLELRYAAVGFLTRAVDLGSGVSPTVPVLCLGAALTLWSLAELARLRSPNVALADPVVCDLMSQTVGGGLDRLSRSWALLNRSTVAVPAWLFAVAVAVLATTCFLLFDPIFRPLVTIEGPWFGRFAASGLLIVQLMISLSLFQFLYLWSMLRQLLDRMGWHKAAPAYETVPRALYPPGLFPKVPRLMELAPVVNPWSECLEAASGPGTGGEAARVFEADMRTDPHQLWSSSRTWKELLKAVKAPVAGATESGASAVARQRLVEMAAALVVRDALARLQHNLVFVIGGVLLVFCSHTLFPFQLRTFLAELGWTYIAFTFSAILVVLVQMKRNDILRRLTSAEPGKAAGWDAAFFWRVVVFALLPLLTLFAAQFPDIGGVLLRWAASAKSVLP